MPKEKRCKNCNAVLPYSERNGIATYKHKFNYGLDCRCYYTVFLIGDDPRAKKALASTIKKGKSNYEKEQRQKEKDIKNDIVDWKPKLQIKINEIVRLIDIGLPCLAKGTHANQIHAGHIYSRGSNQTIKFNLHNIHRQSAQSNHYQNDDGLLREGLTNEYGIKYMDFVSSLRETPQLKYLNHEYREFTKRASEIALDLKRQGRIFPTIQERISMRNDINNALGIYHQKYCEFEITKL